MGVEQSEYADSERVNDEFSRIYGIPFTWAKQIAEWGGGELSEHWQRVLNSFQREDHESNTGTGIS